MNTTIISNPQLTAAGIDAVTYRPEHDDFVVRLPDGSTYFPSEAHGLNQEQLSVVFDVIDEWWGDE